MKRKNKKHILFPAALLIYVTVLAVITYPRYRESGDWNEYYSVIGISLLLAVLLFFILKRKQKIREQFTKKD
ncbi:MAG: LPXTG cell wall anchor domain-containing protein [Bacteroidales bacterium]|jgi:LPXTG-motif cell wall-anchored protein|nr:LPXTG cell wall anchor domain-containing protein [Bacteroidales bacterium]